MAAKSRYMAKRRIARELADNFVGTAERTKRHSAAKRLGQYHQVGDHAEMLKREEPAGASEPGQDFVEDQHRAGTVATLAQGRDEILAWNPDSPFCLNRLHNYGG